MKLESYVVSPAHKAALLARFLTLPEVVPLRSDLEYFSLVVSLGIHQEIGTIHDELAVFLYDADTGRRVPKELLRSEILRAHDGDGRPSFGVRIWVEGVKRLDPRVRGLRTLTHPRASYDSAGNLHQLVFFPAVILEIAALQGAELVSVRPWGLNTIFGGFDERRSYYEANLWELVNVDVLRYARLLEQRRIVFWGTHDLVSHIAGLRLAEWPELEARGRAVRELLESYFAGVENPAPATLILPYTLGLLLDDLAQPMNYGSETRKRVVSLLMDAIARRRIDPASAPFLLRYPPSIERLVAIARSNQSARAEREGAEALNAVIREIQRDSLWTDKPARLKSEHGRLSARPAV